MKSLFLAISILFAVGFSNPCLAYSGVFGNESWMSSSPVFFAALQRFFIGATVNSKDAQFLSVSIKPAKFTFTVTF